MVRRTNYLVLVMLMLQATFFAATTLGFDNAQLQKFNSTNKCEKCDLSKANFSNLDMYGVDLVGANLTGANLSGASFNDADLRDANLRGANIEGTNFSGAKLSNTIWTDGKKCQSGSIGRCK